MTHLETFKICYALSAKWLTPHQSHSLTLVSLSCCRKSPWLTMSCDTRGQNHQNITIGASPDAHLSKSVAKMLRALSELLNCAIMPFPRLFAPGLQPLMRYGCLLLNRVNNIMYMYRGPQGAAAPPAPVPTTTRVILMIPWLLGFYFVQ